MLITTKRFSDFVKISLHKFTYHLISAISQYPSLITLTVFIASFCISCVEACVAEQFITPRTLDLEVRGSSFARRDVSLDRALYSTLFLFTQVYEWVPVTYTVMHLHPLQGGVAILLIMRHAKEMGLSSGRLGLWLLCAFTLPYLLQLKPL